MAQYFQVSNDKSSNQLYSSSEDAEAVQYILAEKPAAPFSQQQVLISSEPLMVVERQQTVVIDRNQVQFQSAPEPQYNNVQTNGVTINAENRQLFYMEGNSQVVDATQVGQSSSSQPIVLNHQIGTNSPIIRTKVVPSQPHLVRQQMRPQGIPPQIKGPIRPQQHAPRQAMGPSQLRGAGQQMQQPVRGNAPGMANKTPQIRMMRQPPQNSTAQQQQSTPPNIAMFRQQAQQTGQGPKPISKLLQEFQQQQQQQQKSETPKEDEELVLLPDGTQVPVSIYTKMRNQALRIKTTGTQASSPANRAQMASPPMAPSAIQKMMPRQGTPIPRPRQAPPRTPRPGGPRMPVQRPMRPPGPAGFGGPPPRPGPPRYPTAAQQQAQKQQQMQQQQMIQQRMQQISQQQQSQQGQQGGPQKSYLITPPQPNRPQRPLPSYIASSQIQQIIENTPIAEEFADSIRMLVLLENGEQRLITFTLPKEACTIHEILEQVSVPFTPDTNIQVTEANTGGINYIVTVGNVQQIRQQEEPAEPEEPQTIPNQNVAPEEPSEPSSGAVSVLAGGPVASTSGVTSAPTATQATPGEPPKAASPEPIKEAPRLVPGKLAVCNNCGILSEDFNRCTRCKKKFPDNVKAIPAPHNNGDVKITLAGNPNLGIPNKLIAAGISAKISIQSPSAASTPKNSPAKKKPTTRANKIVEHESVVISSDEEEEDEKSAKKIVENDLIRSLGSSITISPITKEPSLNDIKKFIPRVLAPDANPDKKKIILTIRCRTVRIGSYRFSPPEDVLVGVKSITIVVPHIDNKNEMKEITIDVKDIVKVLASFGKALPVVFYYLNPAIAPNIRSMLGMKEGSDTYFDPLSEKEDSFRRITLLPDDFSDEFKIPFQQIYTVGPTCVLEELSTREANQILIKICPKEATKPNATFTEIKEILKYPPTGRGRIAINTEDYICLAQDQFLNDVIIDFYLKYIVDSLSEEKREKVHVFSTFFYKRLTTKPTKASRKCQPTEWDPNLNAAQKRHARVKTWTKNVNLFEKDFVVVPINENAHWFLAIICFPGMNGPHTFDGQPYKLEVAPKKKKNTIKKEKPILCEEPEDSDRDEAEGDESDLESDDSEETPQNSQNSQPVAPAPAPVPVAVPRSKEPRPPIRQPCILIFDSLAGTSRNRVVATLRDYLTCEFQMKTNEERVYNKDVIKGATPKVPQQTNFTDCGLYVLQYVEQFFASPIQDYRMPISSIKNWFEEITVTKKREDIANLIKDLMRAEDRDTNILPEISFPTLNGKLVEVVEKSDVAEEEESDMFTDIEDAQVMDHEDHTETTAEEEEKMEQAESPIKPSVENVSEFVAQPATPSLLKPTTSNRDTLSYLKAKRIIRHKNVPEGPDVKKLKTEGSDSN